MGTLEMQPDTTNTAQDATTDQQKLVRDFFLRDSAPELIESLNTLVEAYLFTPSLHLSLLKCGNTSSTNCG